MIIKKIYRKFSSKIRLFLYKLFNYNNFHFGKSVNIRKRFTPNINGGKLIIGNNVFFNNDCSINCQGKIEIGNDCLFGESIKIYDHNHVFSNLTTPISEQGMKIGEIKIGNNCWIGSNTTILANVEIGDNVVIGANCLIYKSIPSNTIIKNKTELIIQNRNKD